jgi:hypothetical protein
VRPFFFLGDAVKKSWLVIVMCAFVLPAAVQAQSEASGAPVVAEKGKMLMSSNGARLGAIYKVVDGAAQIIIDGKLVTVPANTLSNANGKITTSLSKSEVIALH